MKIFMSSDHAGFGLKKNLLGFLSEKGIKVTDLGPFDFVSDDDYPDWIAKTAEEVSRDPENACGIVIGMSGQGEAIVANKFKNVRAGVYYGSPKGNSGEDIIRLLREHNDSNILSLGAKFVSIPEAQRAVELWLETAFSEDKRHIRRIDKIREIENQT